eukprot:2213621-Pyramimonas_sp.AAC.1
MDATMYWHIQTVLGPIILKVQQFARHLDKEARSERMRVPGSFFSGMPSRRGCTPTLAKALWSGMQ